MPNDRYNATTTCNHCSHETKYESESWFSDPQISQMMSAACHQCGQTGTKLEMRAQGKPDTGEDDSAK